MIDAVITYVNQEDKNWLQQFNKHSNKDYSPNEVNYWRDYNTLKYVLRGISNYMPYIKNIYLVIQSESQIPYYINTDKVKIVLHEQIIPSEYLPTFNSGTIEMFLHNINGLSEQFIYFNDDMIPVNYTKQNAFFKNDKISSSFECYYYKDNSKLAPYQHHNLNNTILSKKLLNLPINNEYIIPLHICSPMLKSKNKFLVDEIKNELRGHISKFRSPANITQQIFAIYQYLGGDIVQSGIKGGYVTTRDDGVLIYDAIHSKKYNITCINDFGGTKERYDFINAMLELKFPDKCEYEN